LSRWLRARGVAVVEVDRPDRRTRRRRGKSDTADAEAAARAVLAGVATAQAKSGSGPMEMVRTLRVARQSALKARTQAANVLHALVVTAPSGMRAQLRHLKLPQFVSSAAAFPLRNQPPTTPTAAAKLALKSIARRYQQLSTEISDGRLRGASHRRGSYEARDQPLFETLHRPRVVPAARIADSRMPAAPSTPASSFHTALTPMRASQKRR
jgi:transposase